MNQRDRIFLNYVVGAIAEIGSFTVDGRDGFMVDRKTQSAARVEGLTPSACAPAPAKRRHSC